MCMSFTQQELSHTADELRSKIHEVLSSRTKPDVLLGHHPVASLASQKQSIAIWHGQRIEYHLSDWINKVSSWNARAGEQILIAGANRVIDTLAWNRSLDIVLVVEAKRVYSNQDPDSQ